LALVLILHLTVQTLVTVLLTSAKQNTMVHCIGTFSHKTVFINSETPNRKIYGQVTM